MNPIEKAIWYTILYLLILTFLVYMGTGGY